METVLIVLILVAVVGGAAWHYRKNKGKGDAAARREMNKAEKPDVE